MEQREGGIEREGNLLSISNSNCWQVPAVSKPREEEAGAVPLLVRPVLAVREVVADQLGVHTGPGVTAELARLLHVKVEVESPGDRLVQSRSEIQIFLMPALLCQRDNAKEKKCP